MTTIVNRYDRAATRYERWWAPVLAPSGRRLIDDLVELAPGASRILDLGTGTGTLALEAVARWPTAEVVGLDSSTGMLEVAEELAARRLDPASRARLRFVAGLAERLPFPAQAFDLVVSAFVVQLVPDRLRVLREAYRVVRPGGWLGYVTWLETAETFSPEAAFDEAVEEVGIDEAPTETGPRSGDVASPAAAAAQLRRAGFRSVRTRAAWLEYRWDAASYLEFVEAYDERDLFESLTEADRARLRAVAAAKFRALPAEAFVWRTPIVFAFGRRP